MNFMEGISAQTVSWEAEKSGERSDSIYKRIASWTAMIGLSLSLLFFLPFTTSVIEANKQLVLVILAGISLVTWMVDVVVRGTFYWRPSLISWGVGAVWLSSLLAAVFSPSWFESVFGVAGSVGDSLIVISALAVLYLVASVTADDEGFRLRQILNWSIVIALLVGFLQMIGLSLLGLLSVNPTVFSTVGSLNSLGILAAVSLAVLYRISPNSDNFTRYASKVGLVLAIAILAILNWWVLWTVAIVAMASVITLDNFSRERNGFRLSRFVFPMAVIVIAVFLLIINFDIPVLKNKFPIEVAPSHSLSAEVAKESLKRSFIFGLGPETFYTAFNKHGASNLATTNLSNVTFFDASSQVMTWVTHTGIVGVVALLLLFVLIILSLWRAARTGRIAQSSDVGIHAGLIALIVAMFLYPFNVSLMIVWYCLLTLSSILLFKKQIAMPVESRPTLSLLSSLGFIAGLILALVGVYFMVTVYMADVAFARAAQKQEVEPAIELINTAISLNGQDSRYYRSASQAALILIRQQISGGQNDPQRNEKIQNYVSSAIQLAQRATAVNPRNPDDWSNLGSVYRSLIGLVDGVDVLAEQAFTKASELRPGDPSYANLIGDTYLAKADLSAQFAAQGGSNAQKAREDAAAALLKAEQGYKKAIEISNNFGLAIYSLGGVYDRQGKVAEAIKQLETLKPFNGDQPNLAFELGLLYYRNNQKDKAQEELQRAVTLSPDFANARWYLALVFEERGDLTRAIEQLEKILAIEANKDNETVKQKLDALKTGQISKEEVTEQQPIE